MSSAVHTVRFAYGEHEVVLTTGLVANQADGAVWVQMGKTVVLVTAVAQTSREPKNFLGLSVHYQEKAYAGGRIPGGFFKRENRPSEQEVLISRLIDRPLRPTFPEGFYHEIQIIATVLSFDPQVPADIPALLGAAAAVKLAGLPIHNVIGAVRVGRLNDQWVLNPSVAQMADSNLDLVVAGTRTALTMVEAGAEQLSEEQMLEALMWGHQNLVHAIDAIEALAAQCTPNARVWEIPVLSADLVALIEAYRSPLQVACQIRDKRERQYSVEALLQQCIETASAASAQHCASDIKAAFEQLRSQILREMVLETGVRMDGRTLETVRPIQIQLDVLPQTHGSALFTRGETQALVVTTLGTERDAQAVDGLEGERKETFMLHYNFPPYSVGEVGMMSGPRRRDLGHGRLARRAIETLLPSQVEFPYVVRVVSEITASNGSSSMASVCGASLSLMSAGVPLRAPVAGVAMGLIQEGKKYAILTDILGDEDHLGDMDFKVAGTHRGITALQMDIKIDSIDWDILKEALAQARRGRLSILGSMELVIQHPRLDVSVNAPRILSFKIPVDKIREVIGKSGSVIKAIIESTGTSIDIDDDGTIKIASVDESKAQEAKAQIERITAEVELGQVYQGTVVKVLEVGAITEILPGKSGLIHISEISHERTENVADVLSEGQVVNVKVVGLDKQGRIRLSIKATVVQPGAELDAASR